MKVKKKETTQSNNIQQITKKMTKQKKVEDEWCLNQEKKDDIGKCKRFGEGRRKTARRKAAESSKARGRKAQEGTRKKHDITGKKFKKKSSSKKGKAEWWEKKCNQEVSRRKYKKRRQIKIIIN